MEESTVIKERKEKLFEILRMKDLFSAFAVLAAVSLIICLLEIAGMPLFFLGYLGSLSWFLLSVAFALSAVIFYYKKNRFGFYPILAWIVWISTEIRITNLPGLRDITTGGWTLGPDLDPFLFLRWAKYIVVHGSIYAFDAFRNVPLGFDTRGELLFHPYLIAWFHKIASFFGSISVDQSAALYPVFMFALTAIVFFFLVRKIFRDNLGETNSNIVALIASFFLVASAVILPRTIAGDPEKESAGFLFLFLSFYLFLSAWKSQNKTKGYILALLAGLSTAGMALVWGGYIFIFLTIEIAVFFAFVLGQLKKNNFINYAIWLASSCLVMNFFSTRYDWMTLIESTTTGLAFAVLFVIIVHYIIFGTKLKRYFESPKISKIPKPVISLIASIILGLVAITIILGPSFITHTAQSTLNVLVTPVADRFGVTVAENKQPYFDEWASNFGPTIHGIPLLFWLFFIGSIYLFYRMVKPFSKKERIILTLSYAIFITFIIFSRYTPDSSFNGTSGLSLLTYFVGVLVLIGTAGYYYFSYNKAGKYEELKSLDFSLILFFVFFFLGITSARGAVRLVMLLSPAVAVLVAYLSVGAFNSLKNVKGDVLKLLMYIFVALILVSSLYSAFDSYATSKGVAGAFVPNAYNQQWQKAMAWVRTETPQNSVFGHWWDYGYWVQTLGERATVLDGGNVIVYWNYMMGRYALTAPDDKKAIEFLYAHNTTHFLIDSSDIGKYGAFSSIGSDENYDRRSWISAFIEDDRQTVEQKNSTLYVYSGGIPSDEDIIYNINGTRIFLPGGKTAIAGVIIEKDLNGTIISPPSAVYIYQGKQYVLPMRYLFKDKLIDFGKGIESGVFLMPRLIASQNNIQLQDDGALLFLSNRTVKSQVARLYLYNEDNQYFKLAHSEDDFVVAQLKSQFKTQFKSTNDFVYFDSVRGPIRIWNIKYPVGMSLNETQKEEYLRIDYPNPALRSA